MKLSWRLLARKRDCGQDQVKYSHDCYQLRHYGTRLTLMGSALTQAQDEGTSDRPGGPFTALPPLW
jgi:hypothetical protein